MKSKSHQAVLKAFQQLIRLPLTFANGGFTLIEILVVVLIIGILGAIALPQYQRAVLKSRYAGLMPIAKAMADSNEAYFLEHGVYAANAQDLPVQGRQNYPDGTELEFGTSSDYSYVLATRNNNFPNNYIVYQKHSGQFPGEIHCEANANDTQAQEVCKSYGPTADIGETLTSGYLTYVLFGTGNGEAPEPPCDGVTCDAQGNITECASGLTLNNGACVTCDIANAATCSTTSYAAASCNEGYVLNAGACEADPTYAKLLARANSLCPDGGTRYVCTIKNGAVYRCDTNYATVDSETGECGVSSTIAYSENIYDADGNRIGFYYCINASSGHCTMVKNLIPTADGGSKYVDRYCADKAAITKEGVCSNGYSDGNSDTIRDSHGQNTSEFRCSRADISTTTGECNKYNQMSTWENSYSTNGNRSYVRKYCTTATTSNPEATCSGSWQIVDSKQYNEEGTAYKQVYCNGRAGRSNPQPDGCPSSSPNLESYDSATNKFTTCTNGVNWETATCK